jgi:hypothetical protein
MKQTAMLLVAGLVAGVPALAAQPGEQHNWYILSFKDGECHAAATFGPRIATPEQFHNLLRNHGVVDEIHVDKDDDGNVNSVTISFTPPGGTEGASLWFPSSDLCEMGKTLAEANG